MSTERFTAMEKRIFAGCFLAYCMAYMARLNLAAALPQLCGDLGLSQAKGGLIQTVFAIVYAAGQLCNGALADRISPRRHVTLGLGLSALCNLLFGLSRAYWLLLALWAFNGAAQSMLWTPIVRLIAAWFTGEKRARASFYMCVTFVLGHFLAWAAAGYASSLAGWRLSFGLSAGVALLAAVLARGLLRDLEDAPEDDASSNISQNDAHHPHHAPMPVRELLLRGGLVLALFSCVASGFARDGVMTWAPTILTGLQGGAARGGFALSATALSLLIPLMNLAGLALGRILLTKAHGNIRRTAGGMLLTGAALSVILILLNAPPMLVYALLLGALCALMYSVCSMQTVMLPMEYFATGRVSLVAGLCDCATYAGSSLVGVVSGALMQKGGLSAAYLAWAVASVLGAAALLLAARSVNARVRVLPRKRLNGGS